MVRLRKFSVLIAAIAWMSALSPSVAEENEEREGGIVGTGIVGIINSLGSIHVNGQIIDFSPELPIISSLGPRVASSLKPGETVVVEAVRQADKWTANSIRHMTPLLGPIDGLSDNVISILGTSALITADTVLGDGLVLSAVKSEQWLAVDGIWKKDVLIASYIRKIEPRAAAQVTASYFGLNVDDEVRIGGVRISNFRAQHSKPGDVITVVGTPRVEGLSAQTVTRGLFKNKLKSKLVEGFLSQPDETGFYTIYGSGTVAFVSQSDALMPNGRGVHCVIYDEDDQIKRVLDLPESFELRKQSFIEITDIGSGLCF